MTAERIVARYRLETPYPLTQAAEALAREQSTGTFVRVPGETDVLRERFGARVEEIRELETAHTPSLPGTKLSNRAQGLVPYRRAEVLLSFPAANVGTSLPNLLTLVAGNLYELQEVSGLKLLDVEFPRGSVEAYPGPQFGILGTRRLTSVFERPIIGTIVKPSVGLAPEETASVVQELAEAGLDFIKDDELIANPPYSPLSKRARTVMDAIHRVADRTGKRTMYAFNITDDLEQMLRHHDAVLEAGGTCVMVSLNSAGLAAVSALRRHSQLPIHGHRNGWGALNRHPYLGMEFTAYQKFWRLAGVDHIHTNGLRNKFAESDESVIASVKACLAPMFGGYSIMPVLSSGQWAGQVPDTYRSVGSVDLMYLCGGGILAHPGGITAGVMSVRQAWEAALMKTPLTEYARNHHELRQALEAFGQQ